MAGADRLGGRKTLKVSGFLEEFEKEAVKKRVDIVELFASFGVELTRKGKSYVGLCPWHADKDPSLSVDREQGLFHCFGCGESGDVVSLVEKMKGVGFREALEVLKGFEGKREAASEPARKGPAAGTRAGGRGDAARSRPRPGSDRRVLPQTAVREPGGPGLPGKTGAENA